MAEFEELQLRVTLTDQASRPLQQLEEQYKRLAGGQTQGHMDKFKREGNYLKEGIKLLGLEAKGAGAHFEQLAGRAGLAAGAVAAAGFAVYEATKRIAEFAQGIREVGRFAEELGTTYAHVKNITDQMAKLGVSEESTRKNIEAGMRSHVEAMTRPWPEFIQKTMEILRNDDLAKELQQMSKNAVLPEDQQEVAIRFNERIAQYYREHRLAQNDADNEQLIKDRQRRVLEAQGFNMDVTRANHITKLSQEQEDRLNKMHENAKQVADDWNAIWTNIGKVGTLLASSLFDPEQSDLPRLLKNVRELTDWIFKSVLAFETGNKNFWQKILPDSWTKPSDTKLEDLKPWAPGGWNWGQDGGAQRFTGGDNLPASQKFGDNSEKVDENTRELKKLNDNLYELLNPTDKTGNLQYQGGALGDRASGSSYSTAGGGQTGRTAPVSPGPITVSGGAAGGLFGAAAGSFPILSSPFNPFMTNKGALPGAEGLRNPTPSTMAPPANPGGGPYPFNDNTDVRGYAFTRAIGQTESSLDPKEAYSDRYNLASNNANVARVGEAGADYGYLQMNQTDVRDAINLGMSPEQARHLSGGGRGGGKSSSLDQQLAAGNEYLRRKFPAAYQNLVEKGDYQGMVDATHAGKSWKWFGLRDHPGAAKAEYDRTMDAARVSAAAVAGGVSGGGGGGVPGASGMHSVRTTLDKGIRGQEGQSATGHIEVEIPNPMQKGSASGTTLFNKTPMERQIQMMPTQVGPPEPARAAAVAG